MKKALVFIIVVALLGGLAYVAYKTINNEPIIPNDPGEDTPRIIVDEPTDAASKVRVESVVVRNKTDNIDINNVYPTITSFTNKEFENSINKQIASTISDYRAEISSMVDDLTPEIKLYKYVTSYKKNTWGNYLTLVIEQDYQTGGIRSNTWKDIYNIDVAKERIIYLSDLFEPTTDYQMEIVHEIMSQAAAKNYKLMGGEGITRLPTTQKFYIQNGKLVIYFDPSEVAATSYGALEFEMPFVLNSNGYFQVR